MDNAHLKAPLFTMDPFGILGKEKRVGRITKSPDGKPLSEQRKEIAAQLFQGMLANSFMVSETWEVAKEKAKGDHGLMNHLAFETLAQFSIQATDILIAELDE